MARLLSIYSQLSAARPMFANMDTVSSVCLLNSFCFHNPSSKEIIKEIVQKLFSFDGVNSMLLVVAFLCNQVLYSIQ